MSWNFQVEVRVWLQHRIKLNIPAGLVFVILKQAETVQLHNERRRAGTEGLGLEKVRAQADFQTLKSSVLSERPSGVRKVWSART
jgi:hypothetical protein